jgi:MFS family permease
VKAAGLLGVPASILGAWLVTHKWWVVAAVLLVWLALVLARGAWSENDLRLAALSWPRLCVYRPKRYEWETSRIRWLLPVFQWLIAAFIAAALVLPGRQDDVPGVEGTDWVDLFIALAIVASLAAFFVYLRWMRPRLRKAKAEETAVRACRKQGRPHVTCVQIETQGGP